jgi:hypothetical protein
MALARKILAYAREAVHAGPEHLQAHTLWLDRYLDNYLHVVRDVLLLQAEKVREGADVIIDGKQDMAAMTAFAVNAILEKSE